MKKTVLSIFLLAAGFAFCAEPSDISSYKSGGSMAWYHELIRDAHNPEKSAQAEDIVLKGISEAGVSDEAFRLSCKILKVAATEKSVKALPAHLSNKNRVSPVFDALVSCKLPAADKALFDALKSEDKNVARHAMLALGARKNASAVAAIAAAAKSADKATANAAVSALGSIPSPESAGAIASLASRADKAEVKIALERLRENLLKAGLAKQASKIKIPDADLYDIYFSGMASRKAPMKRIDAEMSNPKSEISRYAARFANSGRTFENSSALVKAYKNLPDAEKVAAIRSFALSKDKRFYGVISADIGKADTPVSKEALYACEFIAPDSAVEKIVSLLDVKNNSAGKQSGTSRIAEYVLSRMPSKAVQTEIEKLYAETKSPICLRILIERGTPKIRAELASRLMDPKEERIFEISKIADSEIGYDGLKIALSKIGSADAKTRKRALQTLVKFMSKDRNIEYRKKVFDQYFASVKFTDAEREMLESRLFSEKKKK